MKKKEKTRRSSFPNGAETVEGREGKRGRSGNEISVTKKKEKKKRTKKQTRSLLKMFRAKRGVGNGKRVKNVPPS